MLFHANLGGSPTLLTTHTAAREWLHEKDANRLDTDQVERPNTRWVFQRWVQVNVKTILVEQPLLGQGRLPDWLRSKKGLYALDTFNAVPLSLHCSAPWSELAQPMYRTASEITYIVSGGALNSTHLLTPMYRKGCRTGETIRWCQRPAGTALARRGVHRAKKGRRKI